MHTQQHIEQRIKFKNCIMKFKKYFTNLDESYKMYLIGDINAWINLYKDNNKSDSSDVNNFYNHISDISSLLYTPSNLRRDQINRDQINRDQINRDRYWTTLFSFIDLEECRDFIRFLKNISTDDIEEQ